MTGAELLVDAFGRVRETVHQVTDGLTEEQATARLDQDANSIAWLLWHLTRIQDDHVADAAQTDQIWTTQGWRERFELPFAPEAHGYGQSSREVAAVRVGADLLVGYYDAVHARTIEFIGGLKDRDFDRIVDEAWDPPVDLGTRLVSVVNDCTQHVGQAAFIRGVLKRSKR